jgi:hypothetical protein
MIGARLTQRDLIVGEHAIRDVFARFFSFKAHSLYFPRPEDASPTASFGPNLDTAMHLPGERRVLPPLTYEGRLMGVFVARGAVLPAPKAMLPLLPRIGTMAMERLALAKAAVTDPVTGLSTGQACSRPWSAKSAWSRTASCPVGQPHRPDPDRPARLFRAHHPRSRLFPPGGGPIRLCPVRDHPGHGGRGAGGHAARRSRGRPAPRRSVRAVRTRGLGHALPGTGRKLPAGTFPADLPHPGHGRSLFPHGQRRLRRLSPGHRGGQFVAPLAEQSRLLARKPKRPWPWPRTWAGTKSCPTTAFWPRAAWFWKPCPCPRCR